jgi:transcriptional regulator with XRE-family HTH domain
MESSDDVNQVLRDEKPARSPASSLASSEGEPLTRGVLKAGDEPQARRKEIGDNVRRLREAKDWSQETLARQVGCSPRVISRVELGLTALYFHLLDTIAGALGVDPGQLVPRTPLPPDKDRPEPQVRKRPPPSSAAAEGDAISQTA